MHEKILVVDDDYGICKLIETILIKFGYIPNIFTSSSEALHSFKTTEYDLVISDLSMPGLTGEGLLKEIRFIDSFLPFIVITTNSDIKNAVKLIKEGADDYIIKPVEHEQLLFRIEKTLIDSTNKKVLNRIEKEKEILALESKRLADWKELYANKDVKQTDQVINLFTRTLNQGGGYIWLDILKSQAEKIDDESYKINSSLIDLIIKSSEQNQIFFDNISFISNLESIELNLNKLNINDFVDKTYSFIENDMSLISEKYSKKLFLQKSDLSIKGYLNIDTNYLEKVIKELIINSLKYSEDNSNIFFMIDKNVHYEGNHIDISIKNTPKKMNAKDLDGKPIIGIPYEYSELVFDLFYTIDPFPKFFPEEEWASGTGLFIIRKLLKQMNSFIKTANGLDYTKGEPSHYIKFTISLPFSNN